MSKKLKYTNVPLGEVRAIKDFLPPPGTLVFKPKTVKVTMALSKPSVDFFKKQAQKYHTHYQTMIKNLLDAYAGCHNSKTISFHSSKPSD